MNISDTTPSTGSKAPGLPLKRQTGSLEDSLCTDLKGDAGSSANLRVEAFGMINES
jgi:hypothetical protein